MKESTEICVIRLPGVSMLFYRAVLPLPARPVLCSRNHPGHRKSAGWRWRRLNPGQQALLFMVYLRKGEMLAETRRGIRDRRYHVLARPGNTRRRRSPCSRSHRSCRRCGTRRGSASPMSSWTGPSFPATGSARHKQDGKVHRLAQSVLTVRIPLTLQSFNTRCGSLCR